MGETGAAALTRRPLHADPRVRLEQALRTISPDGRAMLHIAGVVILANLPYLLGVFDANPLGPRGSLVSAAVAGPVGGQPTIDPNNGSYPRPWATAPRWT